MSYLIAYMLIGSALMTIAAIFDSQTASGAEVRRAVVIGLAFGIPWSLMIFALCAVVYADAAIQRHRTPSRRPTAGGSE